MGKKSTKHINENLMSLNDFSGGLNLCINREAVASNELVQAENVEFNRDTGALSTACGIRSIFNSGIAIDSLYYDVLHDIFLFSSGNKLYSTNLSTKTEIGTLAGSHKPTFAPFSGVLMIASGDVIQTYDGSNLTSISGSPISDIVINREGRLVAARIGLGYDSINYSAIGDATSATAWTNDPDDASSAQWLNVGYQDGSYITAIVPISQDLLIFKKRNHDPFGYVYRIVNDYPNWAVYQVSENIHCSNQFSAAQVLNDVFYIGNEGFNAISTVVEYGSVKQNMTGKKVNGVIINSLDNDEARVWHLPYQEQIWVKPQDDNVIYLYHYINGAFTTRRFTTGYVADIAIKDNDVYLAIGQKILLLDPKIYTEDDKPINSIWTSRRFVSEYQYLLKHIILDLFNLASGVGSVKIGALSFPIGVGTPGVFIYGDTGKIYGDTADIYENPTTQTEFYANYVTTAFDVQLQMVTGAASVRAITLRTSEV